MKEEFENQTRPVSVTVEWGGAETEDRDSFLTSLGLNPARWQEGQIARITPDTQFKIFGMALRPREPYAVAAEWKCRGGRLPEGWMGFTINETLVAASLLGAFRDRADLNPGMELLRSIQGLSLITRSAVVPAWLSELGRLEVLMLGGCNWLKTLHSLGEITQLCSLSVVDCESLSDISDLRRIKSLTGLNLSGCASLTNISDLGRLTGLTSLDLSRCKLVTDISVLGRLTSLTSLDLSWCKSVTDISVLGRLTSLTSLRLRGCDSLTDISVLGRLKGLTSLDLSWCDSLNNISPLGGLTCLTILNLGRCKAVTDISVLGGLTSLTSLNLRGCDSLSDISILGALASLTSLDLRGCDSLTDVSILGALASLTSLDLSWCKSVTDIGVLGGLTRLTSLNLGGCRSLADIAVLGRLHDLVYLNIEECPYLDPARLNPLFALRCLERLDLDMPPLRLRILLNAAESRVDLPAILTILVVEESLTVLVRASDPDLARRMAHGISVVGIQLPDDFPGRLLSLSLKISAIPGEMWFQILHDVACGCPGALAAWFSGLSEKEVLPAAFLSGLLQFVAEERRLDDLEWSPLLEDLLEKVSKVDQIELGPQICLAWRVLGESGKEAEWMKRLTTPESGGFADKVLVQFALHDIRKGDMVSATKLLGRFEKGDSGDADTVRRALARTLAATAPEDAGEHMAGVYDEADRKALAGELMAVPGFTQVEANLSRLITILGTDPERFHRLLDLMLTQKPDSEWITQLRRQLTPPPVRGVADELLAFLERPDVRDCIAPGKLKELQQRVLADPKVAAWVLESGALQLLRKGKLITAEAAERFTPEFPSRSASKPARAKIKRQQRRMK